MPPAGRAPTANPDEFADLFDDEAEPVEGQWKNQGHMPSGHVPRQWRDVRAISAFSAIDPDSLTIVDIADSETISFLRATMARWSGPLGQLEPAAIDLSFLTGPDRMATCAVAWWLQRARLPGGRTADGVRYPSRHGVDLECFALWVDLDPQPAGTPAMRAVEARFSESSCEPIEVSDEDLQGAARSLGLVAR